MKRFILLSTVTLLLVILIGSSAFATLARIRSLGNADYFFKDVYHIYANPAYLGMYTNTVYGELGFYNRFELGTEQFTPEDQFLGINYKLYKGLSLGLTLNRFVSTDFNSFFFPSPINPFDLMASYDFENLRLGVGLYHAGNKYELKNGVDYSEESSSGNTALTAGFVFNLMEKHEIEGMLRLNLDRGKLTYTDAGATSTLETDGGNGIQFGARGFFQLTDDFQMVPLIAFGSESISLKGTGAEAGNSTTGDFKENFFIVGLGGNLKLDKGMVVGGLNVTRMRFTDESDTTFITDEETEWFMPGFNLGVEYELTKWLTARMGMEKEFGRYEDKWHFPNSAFFWEEKGRFSSPSSQDFIGLGVGFKFSKFQVDATIGEDNFFEGTYLLSGIQRNLFGIVSAVFTF
ncbi:MAG: hypothetical protein A2W07_05885 [candidate division Zixibacteria bacterium RBG_16_43_9]|nr:MAG: hypothetical protein A2W07_05885 [candidate division Zixibacteria bacterium RBG_16_43_9]